MKSCIVQKMCGEVAPHAAQWQQRCMSKDENCAKHGLNLSSFRYWLR